MTEMNDHQKRIWNRMISSLDAYGSSRTGFYKMVGDLEGGLDAGEFRDQTLIREFYDLWEELEIARALDGDAVPFAEVDDKVDAMRRFLRDKLSDAGGSASPYLGRLTAMRRSRSSQPDRGGGSGR